MSVLFVLLAGFVGFTGAAMGAALAFRVKLRELHLVFYEELTEALEAAEHTLRIAVQATRHSGLEAPYAVWPLWNGYYLAISRVGTLLMRGDRYGVAAEFEDLYDSLRPHLLHRFPVWNSGQVPTLSDADLQEWDARAAGFSEAAEASARCWRTYRGLARIGQ
jgi:hypothetical protein